LYLSRIFARGLRVIDDYSNIEQGCYKTAHYNIPIFFIYLISSKLIVGTFFVMVDESLSFYKKLLLMPSHYRGLRCRLLFLSIIIFGSACMHKGPTWGETISNQLTEPGSIAQIDTLVANFMENYHIPGLSIAISKDEKMVYVKGYGLADNSSGEQVTTKSLFRIADVSEAITAIAIMKLIEEGKLSPDSKVFGDKGRLGNEYGSKPYSANITNITIDELLHQTSGGWSGRYDMMLDPEFRDDSITKAQLISWALDNRPPKTSPGITYG
jgi:CubicO group peptidase (beta-lactamase class C family)